MKVTVIGGTGKVARQLLPELVDAGHDVTATIRGAHREREVTALGASAVVADVAALDVEGFERLLEGSDAVVWTAGAPHGDADQTFAVDRDAPIRSMLAAERLGGVRYVMVSFFESGPGHAWRGTPYQPYGDAKSDADRVLMETSLDYLLLRPSSLTDEQRTGAVEVRQLDASIVHGSIARADVATLVVEALARPELRRCTLDVNKGPMPIARALDDLSRTIVG